MCNAARKPQNAITTWLGYSIGLNNFAKDRCELNLVTDVNFDYLLLSSTFSKRVLQQESYDLQLQGVLAITKLKAMKVIAKGPINT